VVPPSAAFHIIGARFLTFNVSDTSGQVELPRSCDRSAVYDASVKSTSVTAPSVRELGVR
jgi:hypothetical protein